MDFEILNAIGERHTGVCLLLWCERHLESACYFAGLIFWIQLCHG